MHGSNNIREAYSRIISWNYTLPRGVGLESRLIKLYLSPDVEVGGVRDGGYASTFAGERNKGNGIYLHYLRQVVQLRYL